MGWQGATPEIRDERLTDMARRVAAYAEATCQGIRPTADQLRHACHVIALGRDRSSTRFTNADFDRVLTCFRLIANGDDISALIRWDHPEHDQAKRLAWVIGQYPEEAYVRSISADKFGTANWENLSVDQLRQLALTLRERAKAKQRRRMPEPAAAVAAVAADNEPF